MFYTCENLDDINSNVIKKLQQLNYSYINKYEDMMPFRRYFQKDNQTGKRTHQIHLVEFDSDFWKKYLLFRDYLRPHPSEAKRYEKLKQELALKYNDTNEYAKAKTEFCNEIHQKALAWTNEKIDAS